MTEQAKKKIENVYKHSSNSIEKIEAAKFGYAIASQEHREEWVRVEDREPEYYQSVWAEFENGNVAAVWRASTVDEIIYTIVGTDIICPTPLRWMPLPTPPTK